MTIITYKNGECWADDLIWENNFIVGRDQKIFYRKRDKAIIAAGGEASLCETFLAHAVKNKPIPDLDGDKMTGVVFKEGQPFVIWDGAHYYNLRADQYAIGAMTDLAIGMMLAGASAKDAALTVCRMQGWPASLHGVNHEGEWDFVPVHEVIQVTHNEHIPRRDNIR